MDVAVRTTPVTVDALEGHRSVNDVLAQWNALGIPHFQRGLVWDDSAVALLLESIYFGTPCGSILLWKPPQARAHGVPIAGDAFSYLIVDGQQRIRSLHAVFSDSDDDQETSSPSEVDANEVDVSGLDDGNENQTNDGVWCLNLARVPELAQEFPNGRQFRLFRRTRNPLAPRPSDARVFPGEDCLLPLKWFLDHPNGTGCNNELVARAAGAVLGNESVRARVQGMLSRPIFHVSVLTTESLADVVGVYNRINSAGKRVEQEEKAFANLVVQAREDANASLAAFFGAVHPGRSEPIDLLSKHDDLLERQRESRFGFKLFMRAFVMLLAYHTNRSIGSSTFSFDAATADALEEARPHLQAILKRTAKVLEDVADILRNPPLFCDDLRMLPDTEPLWPVFQLLIRFPEVLPDGKEALASLTFRLLLADPEKPQILEMCKRVNRAQGPQDAFAVFETHKALNPSTIARRVKDGMEAQSLTSRCSLLLYWLVRKRDARDFSYDRNVPETAATLRRMYHTDTEALITHKVRPERQHIVPYSHLKKLFEIEGPRPGRHLCHDIGNLTYISEGLNSFTIGVADQPLKLDEEPEVNRFAHLLGNQELLDYYRRTISSTDEKAATTYELFCSQRRELIVGALTEWEHAAREVTAAFARTLKPVPPEPRVVVPAPEDVIRAIEYPESIALELIALEARGDSILKTTQDGEVRISLVHRRSRRSSAQLLRLDLQKGGGLLGLKVCETDLITKFEQRFPDVSIVGAKGEDKKYLVRSESRILDVLGWISGQLPVETER